MADAHSKYSASSFEAAMLCPGKPVLERGKPNPDSEYSAEGTAAHQLLEWGLTQDKPATAFLGRRIPVGLRTFEVDEAMVEPVQKAVGNIRDIVGDGMLLAEQRVTYASFLDVPDDEAWGTSDVIGVRGDELQVHDYKHGRGVEVDAEGNSQMMLYAAGALAAVDDTLGPFKTVRLVIHQPRIKDAPSEWVITVEELKAWLADVAVKAVRRRQAAEQSAGGEGWAQAFLNPNEKSCKFCRAKATCPALRAEVSLTVAAHTPASPDEFDVPAAPKAHLEAAEEQWLAACLAKVDLIEDWCKAVRAEVERRLLAGANVPGFKLVEGRQGNRAWSDPEAAARYLRETVRLPIEKAFDLKVISPTSAEKLAKAKEIGPRQWKTLQEQITRAPPSKHVAPVSDPRPALVVTPVDEDFDTVTAEDPALA